MIVIKAEGGPMPVNSEKAFRTEGGNLGTHSHRTHLSVSEKEGTTTG